LTPIVVDKNNIAETVITEGYQQMEDVYRAVPRDRWPQAKSQAAQ
jgi:D-xylose transport system substrate-binding protein